MKETDFFVQSEEDIKLKSSWFCTIANFLENSHTSVIINEELEPMAIVHENMVSE